jgi:hypothetical protein
MVVKKDRTKEKNVREKRRATKNERRIEIRV